jgi:hypothetical protein
VVQILPPDQDLVPRSFPTAEESHLTYLLGLLRALTQEHVWAVAPWIVRVRG